MSLAFRRKNFFDFFPPPEYLLLSTCGIVVTDVHIKFAELRHGLFGEGFELLHFGKTEHPDGTVSGGIIENQEELAKALKKISSEHGVRYARASLPDEKSYIFTAAIDAVADKDLPDAAAFIVEEYVPVSLAEAVIDFEVVGRNTSAGKIKLAVSVVPKNVVESYISAFEAAGITPISFDVESQAVARAVVPRGDQRAHLVIKLSEGKTAFYVVDDEIVQFSTTLGHGMDAGVEGIRSEMRKVIDFWGDRAEPLGGEAGKIEKVLMCGAGASNAEFTGRFMEGLEIEHSVADVRKRLSRIYDDMKPEDQADYAAAIGLVLGHESKKHV